MGFWDVRSTNGNCVTLNVRWLHTRCITPISVSLGRISSSIILSFYLMRGKFPNNWHQPLFWTAIFQTKIYQTMTAWHSSRSTHCSHTRLMKQWHPYLSQRLLFSFQITLWAENEWHEKCPLKTGGTVSCELWVFLSRSERKIWPKPNTVRALQSILHPSPKAHVPSDAH